jgi:hypothetical protein
MRAGEAQRVWRSQGQAIDLHYVPAGAHRVEVPPNGQGETAQLRISQAENDAGGQVVRLYSRTANGSAFIGELPISARAAAPSGSRVAAVVYMPGSLWIWALVSSTVAQLAAGTRGLRVAVDHTPFASVSAPVGITPVSP